MEPTLEEEIAFQDFKRAETRENTIASLREENDYLRECMKMSEERTARTTRGEILDEAKKHVTGQRQEDYGDPESNFDTIAEYWETHLRASQGLVALTATDVAIMMTLLKLARLGSNPLHKDSWVDVAGYAACGGELAAAKAQQEEDSKRIHEAIERVQEEFLSEDITLDVLHHYSSFGQLEHSDTMITCHAEDKCLGEFCTVHNRSGHSMREFPQHWRDDRGIMERTCPHGVGHPDPDSPWPEGDAKWSHGCCHKSCCTDAVSPAGKLNAF